MWLREEGGGAAVSKEYVPSFLDGRAVPPAPSGCCTRPLRGGPGPLCCPALPACPPGRPLLPHCPWAPGLSVWGSCLPLLPGRRRNLSWRLVSRAQEFNISSRHGPASICCGPRLYSLLSARPGGLGLWLGHECPEPAEPADQAAQVGGKGLGLALTQSVNWVTAHGATFLVLAWDRHQPQHLLRPPRAWRWVCQALAHQW